MNPPPNPRAAECAAAVRAYQAEVKTHATDTHETVLLTWTRPGPAASRTFSDEEIAAWYAGAGRVTRGTLAVRELQKGHEDE